MVKAIYAWTPCRFGDVLHTEERKANGTSPAKPCQWAGFHLRKGTCTERAPFSEDVISVIVKITNRLLGSGWDGAGNDGRDLLVVLQRPQAGPGKGEANSWTVTCPRAALGTTHGETLAAGSCERLQRKGALIFCPEQQEPEQVPLVCPGPAPPILPLYAVSQLS